MRLAVGNTNSSAPTGRKPLQAAAFLRAAAVSVIEARARAHTHVHYNHAVVYIFISRRSSRNSNTMHPILLSSPSSRKRIRFPVHSRTRAISWWTYEYSEIQIPRLRRYLGKYVKSGSRPDRRTTKTNILLTPIGTQSCRLLTTSAVHSVDFHIAFLFSPRGENHPCEAAKTMRGFCSYAMDMVTLNGENSTRSAFVAVTVVPVERKCTVPVDGAHDQFSPSGLKNSGNVFALSAYGDHRNPITIMNINACSPPKIILII